MFLRTIGTGSSGNCHLLTASNGETLILDCGVPISEIKKGLDWNIKNVVGCIVTHRHGDHSKSVYDLRKIGIKVATPYLSNDEYSLVRLYFDHTRFRVIAFELTTKDGKWTHTNADGSECPCYGYVISHPEMGKLLYVTDTEFVKWRFDDLNHILLGVDYDKNMVDMNNPAKASHVIRGHMSIDTACKFVKANYSPDDVKNVIMCHLSEENADKDNFIEQMKKVAIQSNVDVAEPCKEWELHNPSVAPF